MVLGIIKLSMVKQWFVKKIQAFLTVFKGNRAFKVCFLFILTYGNLPKAEINIKTPRNAELKG